MGSNTIVAPISYIAHVLTIKHGLQVQYDPEVTGPRHFIAALDAIGFAAQLTDRDR